MWNVILTLKKGTPALWNNIQHGQCPLSVPHTHIWNWAYTPEYWCIPLSHSFGSSRGHRALLLMTIVRLSWLILGAQLFETILASTPLWIYFTFHQRNVSVLHGCQTNTTFHSFVKREGTAGPQLMSPDLFLAGCRKRCRQQTEGRS